MGVKRLRGKAWGNALGGWAHQNRGPGGKFGSGFVGSIPSGNIKSRSTPGQRRAQYLRKEKRKSTAKKVAVVAGATAAVAGAGYLSYRSSPAVRQKVTSARMTTAMSADLTKQFIVPSARGHYKLQKSKAKKKISSSVNSIRSNSHEVAKTAGAVSSALASVNQVKKNLKETTGKAGKVNPNTGVARTLDPEGVIHNNPNIRPVDARIMRHRAGLNDPTPGTGHVTNHVPVNHSRNEVDFETLEERHGGTTIRRGDGVPTFNNDDLHERMAVGWTGNARAKGAMPTRRTNDELSTNLPQASAARSVKKHKVNLEAAETRRSRSGKNNPVSDFDSAMSNYNPGKDYLQLGELRRLAGNNDPWTSRTPGSQTQVSPSIMKVPESSYVGPSEKEMKTLSRLNAKVGSGRMTKAEDKEWRRIRAKVQAQKAQGKVEAPYEKLLSGEGLSPVSLGAWMSDTERAGTGSSSANMSYGHGAEDLERFLYTQKILRKHVDWPI